MISIISCTCTSPLYPRILGWFYYDNTLPLAIKIPCHVHAQIYKITNINTWLQIRLLRICVSNTTKKQLIPELQGRVPFRVAASAIASTLVAYLVLPSYMYTYVARGASKCVAYISWACQFSHVNATGTSRY